MSAFGPLLSSLGSPFMLWHLLIEPRPGQTDLEGLRLSSEAKELGLGGPWTIAASRGFLIEGNVDEAEVRRIAETLLVDLVVERFQIKPLDGRADHPQTVHVMPKPGVTDPEGESALALLRDLGFAVTNCRTIRSFVVDGPADGLARFVSRVLSNDAVELAVVGAITIDHLGQGHTYTFKKIDVALLSTDDAGLVKISKDGQLALNIDEMRTIQAHFATIGRNPTDCELETIAQTWSEHCSHKTLRGKIEFEGEVIDNLLKQTIFKATVDLNLDWLVSVFEDNAGVVRFDDDFDVCFKVETHNHPSAIDPYGGANTGLGGVIRDILGTGLAGKPIANTDVFCVAPPDTLPQDVPPGVLHPKRVLEGIVAGVRDYGNRMGIPTVNGALAVDPRYLANPLVFCGTVGVIPRGMSTKTVEPGDRIVALGGRTGRDGIHGATFSSLDLTGDSEEVSGGAVQIGNAIVEKMVLDVILQARDRKLFRSVTDCGAGGFSSAVGEMGATTGAVVDLEKAPLKYEGLSYTEIWISEAQERMVLAVPPAKWAELKALCDSEGVEATDLGAFADDGKLVLRYDGNVVADLSMDFLHEGRPKIVRKATAKVQDLQPIALPGPDHDYNADLLAILRHWDVASKEWIIRQYDHEVQARTVIKPLVGEHEDGPGDASVIQPVRGSHVGLSISCGINPRWGDLDPYAMAVSCVDEAIRNAVAVGADPDRIALLDNFCWGNPERPETLGSLVLAAKGCHDAAIGYGAPFISGKDSLYNEYAHNGTSLAIPPTLLISAFARVPDVRKCVTMDLKRAGNHLALIGETRRELAGSLFAQRHGGGGRFVPRPNVERAKADFRFIHAAIQSGLIRSCHDLSEGGLAVALAEMAIAGGLGAEFLLASNSESGLEPNEREGLPRSRSGGTLHLAHLLFAESPSRFLIEFEPENRDALKALYEETISAFLSPVDQFPGGPNLGRVIAEPRLRIREGMDSHIWIDQPIVDLKAAWQRPLHETPRSE